MQTVSYTVILGVSLISVLYLQKTKEQNALCDTKICGLSVAAQSPMYLGRNTIVW